jgi:exonuclease SbcC
VKKELKKIKSCLDFWGGIFESQDESRRIEILEAFHTIKEQYRQIFLISHEMEIKEMFEGVVEL